MKQTQKLYIDNLLTYLSYLADYDYQKRVWREMGAKQGDMCISYTESVCMVFDDTGLGDAMNEGWAIFDAQADQAIKELSDLIDVTKQDMPDRMFIDTPQMQYIRNKALQALHMILQSKDRLKTGPEIRFVLAGQ